MGLDVLLNTGLGTVSGFMFKRLVVDRPRTLNPKPQNPKPPNPKPVFASLEGLRAFEAFGLSGLKGFLGVVGTADDINPALYLKDPKLWELWYIPSSGVLQD